MLTLEDFKKKYPKAFCWDSFISDRYNPGMRFIKEGLLQFTEETACMWAGPFEGGHAHFVIKDYTNAIHSAGRHKGRRLLEVWHEHDLEIQTKIDRGYYIYNPKEHPYFCKGEDASLEYPIKFYMCGNDDTSYSKFYATEQEALEELELFIASEPLDFKIIWDFKFAFTN